MPAPDAVMSPLFQGKDRARFEKLRRSDPEKNLVERWKKVVASRPDLAERRLGYVPQIIEHGWAVIAIPEESLAYTIGLNYRFGQPELLLSAPKLEVAELQRILNQLGHYVQLEWATSDASPVIRAGEPVALEDFGIELAFSAYSDDAFERYPSGYLATFEQYFEDRQHHSGGTLPVLWASLAPKRRRGKSKVRASRTTPRRRR